MGPTEADLIADGWFEAEPKHERLRKVIRSRRPPPPPPPPRPLLPNGHWPRELFCRCGPEPDRRPDGQAVSGRFRPSA